MPIIDTQRRLHEAGRIRLGRGVPTDKGKMRPVKLEEFRFTSQNERLIQAIAGMYGGTVQPWADAPVGKQYEAFTQTNEIDILLPPEKMAFSQWYELWSGGGCLRRCDGYRQTNDLECQCDPEKRECDPHTRLSVLLADIPGSGTWRLDTQGFNAMNELNAGVELATMIGQATGRSILTARLRLEQREQRKPGEAVKRFAVPVLDLDGLSQLVRELQPALATGPAPMAALGPVTPVPAQPVPSLAEQMEQATTEQPKTRRRNSQEPIRPTGRKARTAAEVHINTIDNRTAVSAPPPTTTTQLRPAPIPDPSITGRSTVEPVVEAEVLPPDGWFSWEELNQEMDLLVRRIKELPEASRNRYRDLFKKDPPPWRREPYDDLSRAVGKEEDELAEQQAVDTVQSAFGELGYQ